MSGEQGVVYLPEEFSLLGEVFDRTVESLPAAMRSQPYRAAIAKNILACAAAGERDPIELELAARVQLRVSIAS